MLHKWPSIGILLVLIGVGCSRRAPTSPALQLEAPLPLTPGDGSLDVLPTLAFSWSAATRDSETFTLQIAKDTTFSNPAVNVKDIRENSIQIEGLEPATLYYWRVRARSATDSSAWSPVPRFTTIRCPYRIVATIPVGNRPSGVKGVAAHPNGQYIYVTVTDDDQVAVIRTADNQVIARVSVGRAPSGIEVLPDGRYAYVANYLGRTVSVIRTADNIVVATVPVGPNPIAAAALPNGQYVYVSTWDSVSVIRTADNAVVASIPVGESNWGIAALPNGNTVYVASANLSTVFAIRTADHAVVDTIGINGGVYGIAPTPDGSRLYITTKSWGTAVVRTADHTILKYFNWGGEGVVVLPNGRYAYTSCGAIFRTADDSLVTTNLLGGAPRGIAALPGNDYLYISNQPSNNVSVLGF
jgi:YVTN family beta-propeller protein